MSDGDRMSAATYEVWSPEDGETRAEAKRLDATGPREAAEEWARLDDWYSAEGLIVSGRSTPVVCVARVGSDDVSAWRVTGRSVPVYDARPVKVPAEVKP
jgi:hypothetical protein